MKEKRGILGGEKNNMVKSQPKKRINKLYNNDVLILNLELHIRNKNHKLIEYNDDELELFINSCIQKYFEDKNLVKIID